jgi:hypothetical protein
MRRLAVLACSALLAATGAAAAGGAAAQPVWPGSQAVAAKTCSSGFTHAVINHKQKCLRRGEFCAHRYRKQYQRYGYDCVKRDGRGNYHLT